MDTRVRSALVRRPACILASNFQTYTSYRGGIHAHTFIQLVIPFLFIFIYLFLFLLLFLVISFLVVLKALRRSSSAGTARTWFLEPFISLATIMPRCSVSVSVHGPPDQRQSHILLLNDSQINIIMYLHLVLSHPFQMYVMYIVYLCVCLYASNNKRSRMNNFKFNEMKRERERERKEEKNVYTKPFGIWKV